MISPLYFYVLLGSIIIPLGYSIFRIDFIRKWRNFGISTMVMALIFLIWDAIFTDIGIWGFNDLYCMGIYILKMPLEEWLFFFVIPFCSLFTHFAIFHIFPDRMLSKKAAAIISLILIAISITLISLYASRSYTTINFLMLLLILIVGVVYKIKLLQQFYMSFIIILIPFFIVNGILTGAFSEEPIVWYNDLENMGFRIFTIPIEDIGYAFSMLFGNLMIFDSLNNLKRNKSGSRNN